MCLNMHKISVLCLFLAFSSHGECLKRPTQQTQSQKSGPSKALAMMLLAKRPATGFQSLGTATIKAPLLSTTLATPRALPTLKEKGFFRDGTPWPANWEETGFDDGWVDLSSYDKFIETIRTCSLEDMKYLVGKNINKIDNRIYVRIAELYDDVEAEGDQERMDEYEKLSNTLHKVVYDMMKAASKLQNRDAQITQEILKSMADENGEFWLPLSKKEYTALREKVRSVITILDEGYLATCKAYMKKADGDGYKEMVTLIRAAIQMWCAERLILIAKEIPGETESKTTIEILETPPEAWDFIVKQKLVGDEAQMDGEQWLSMVQLALGEAVVSLPSGSPVQAALAEYFQEMTKVARQVIGGAPDLTA